MTPFPTPAPELVLDAWQQYTVAVREWQADAVLLVIFAVVTIGALLVVNSTIGAMGSVFGSR